MDMKSWIFRWLLVLAVLIESGHGLSTARADGWGQDSVATAAAVPTVTMGKPVPLVTMQQPVPLRDNPPPPLRVRPKTSLTEEYLTWMPVLVTRGSMPEGQEGGYVSLYGPPPVPPPNSSANPFPPASVGPPPETPPSVGPPANSGIPVDQPLQNSWWDKTCGWCKNLCTPHSNGQGGMFQSDQAFKDVAFISPVSNPFFSMNPLSLTELRPIFMYQTIPTKNAVLGGGNVEFYGLQGSLAINECLSVVIDKLGFITLDPHDKLFPYANATGFGELWLGPKWTFFRMPEKGTAIAAGLDFQIPVGAATVFQNTGTLGLDPYISFAQNIPLGAWGGLNLMNTTGVAFGVDSQRSDYFHSSFHVDYDVQNAHKFYPLLELNWFQYIGNGKNLSQDFEGMDLFNFGATNISGRGTLSIAPGLRYRCNEHLQFGTTIEFMLTSPRDVQDFRWTFDMIFRY